MPELSVAILCGGKGTRAYPHTLEVPKPLLEIGDQPILRHVMDIYAAQGSRRFTLLAGFKAELIADFADQLPDGWDVEVLDTGESANTAERVWAARDRLTDPFFATYGDGLGNVDLGSLLEFHMKHNGCASLTTVPLRSQYGTVDTDGDNHVTRFQEKPVLHSHWINGGFFVFGHNAFSLWQGVDLEKEVLPHLAMKGELFGYRHYGFWKSMDTHKDALELAALVEGNVAPWMESPTASPRALTDN